MKHFELTHFKPLGSSLLPEPPSNPLLVSNRLVLPAEKYEKEANKYWDKFYKANNANFFKDRHWIDNEFAELQASSSSTKTPSDSSSTPIMLRALEVGCGVGNTVFPLLESNPNLYFYALDFSPHAIGLLKKHPDYIATGRCSGYVVDIVHDPLPSDIAPGSLDIVMMIFVLSAISPQNFDTVIAKMASVRIDSLLQCSRLMGLLGVEMDAIGRLTYSLTDRL